MSKAQSIRDYKAAHADASPKEIAEALAKQGVTVTANQVSTTLSTDRAKAKAGKSKTAKTAKPAKAKAVKVAQVEPATVADPLPPSAVTDTIAALTAAHQLLLACEDLGVTPEMMLTAARAL